MSYDSWKTAAPEEDRPWYETDEEEPMATPTKDLTETRIRLSTAAQYVKKAMACSVLGRERRAKLERIERAIYDTLGDIEEELDCR